MEEKEIIESYCLNCSQNYKVEYFKDHSCPGKYLTPFTDIQLLPDNVYILYDMNGGKYYISQNNYSNFFSFYLKYHQSNINAHSHLTLDLNYAVSHTICFDIDYEEKLVVPIEILRKFTCDYIEAVLVPKLKFFFREFDSFSILISTKPKSGGLHVFLPEFRITNDDYEFLCHLLKEELDIYYQNSGIFFKLDDRIKNFSLPYATKINGQPYLPSFFIFVYETHHYVIDLITITDMTKINKELGKIKNRKLVKDTAFYAFIRQPNNLSMLYHIMSPVESNFIFPKRDISFQTTIITAISSNDEQQEQQQKFNVAEFEFITLDQTKTLKQIFKNTYEPINLTSHPKLVYNYLKMYNMRIGELIECKGNAISRWMKILKAKQTPTALDIFHDINIRLKQDNSILESSDHPIKTVLMYNKGAFFMPVFYALSNHLNLSSRQLCSELSPLLLQDSTSFQTWLDKIYQFDPNVIKTASEKFTYSTILYCSGNIHPPITEFRSKLDYVVNTICFAIDETVTLHELVDVIWKTIEINFPIRKISSKEKSLWNPISGQWTCIQRPDEIRSFLNTLIDSLLTCYSKIFKKKCKFKDSQIRNMCYNLLMTSTLFNNSICSLDWRKWVLGTHEGVLDLIIGHIGNVVPEHYVSNKTIMNNWKRLSPYICSPNLKTIHDTLWSFEFFERYVSKLKCSDDDYVVVLREMFDEEGKEQEAMFQAYVHICKFLTFDYNEMYFFMYALASNLIATNWGKFLFIMQGLCHNGKSRVLKLLNTIFGSYAASVDNDAFLLKRNTETKPEIALNAFCCRVMTCEELFGNINENMLKTLTGNSAVAARSLWETHKTGIPTIKLWVSTNSPPSVITTVAFQERVIPFHFRALFTDNPPTRIVDQIAKSKFARDIDEELVNQTALGLFLMMYFIVSQNLSNSDGFLHYPPIPNSILEFKETYLKISSIYNQFKTFIDLQVVQGEVTTIQDLISAIRHFLKITKNTTKVDEVDILKQFDEEFGDRKVYSNEKEYLYGKTSEEEDSDDDEMLPIKQQTLQESNFIKSSITTVEKKEENDISDEEGSSLVENNKSLLGQQDDILSNKRKRENCLLEKETSDETSSLDVFEHYLEKNDGREPLTKQIKISVQEPNIDQQFIIYEGIVLGQFKRIKR